MSKFAVVSRIVFGLLVSFFLACIFSEDHAKAVTEIMDFPFSEAVVAMLFLVSYLGFKVEE